MDDEPKPVCGIRSFRWYQEYCENHKTREPMTDKEWRDLAHYLRCVRLAFDIKD